MSAGCVKFHFHPELLEYRLVLMAALEEGGFHWLSSFRSVDLEHERWLVEIDGIRERDTCKAMVKFLRKRLSWAMHVYHKDNGDWVIALHVKGHGMTFGEGSVELKPDHQDEQLPDTLVEKLIDEIDKMDDLPSSPTGSPEGDPTPQGDPALGDPNGSTNGGLPISIPTSPSQYFDRPIRLHSATIYAGLLRQLLCGTVAPTIQAVDKNCRLESPIVNWLGDLAVIFDCGQLKLRADHQQHLSRLFVARQYLVDVLGQAVLEQQFGLFVRSIAELPQRPAAVFEGAARKFNHRHWGLCFLARDQKHPSGRLVLTCHASLVCGAFNARLLAAATEGKQ